MKKLLLPCLLLLLESACMPMHVDMDIAACPSIGLQKVVFYNGSAASGSVIAPVVADGRTTWSFPEGWAIEISCHYDDGSMKVQKLPQEVRSCSSSKDSPLLCKAEL